MGCESPTPADQSWCSGVLALSSVFEPRACRARRATEATPGLVTLNGRRCTKAAISSALCMLSGLKLLPECCVATNSRRSTIRSLGKWGSASKRQTRSASITFGSATIGCGLELDAASAVAADELAAAAAEVVIVG